jgi:hypothetical protein
MVAQHHTGWPVAPIGSDLSTSTAGGETGFDVGERLPDYHRLDLTASRGWQLPRGLLALHLEVQNLYNHGNLRGFDAFLGDQMQPMFNPTAWAGLRYSLGIRWNL